MYAPPCASGSWCIDFVKLYQITGEGFPDTWAQSFQIARMGSGFLESGVDTTVVYAWSSGTIPWDRAAETYGVRCLPPNRRLRDGAIWSQNRWRGVKRTVLRVSVAGLAREADRASVFFGRHPDFEPMATLLRLKALGLLKARVFVDLHEPRHYSRRFDRHICGYVVTNLLQRGALMAAGVESERILVAPHAVDLHAYEQAQRLDWKDLRTALGLQDGQFVIGYTGQLRARKNVETVVAAMSHLDASTMLFVAGGADDRHVQRVRAFAASLGVSNRVKVLGQQPSAAVLRLQMAADVLVIPHDAQLVNVMLGSPLKLPEYLATGRPIVAFPSGPLREMLREDEVVWANDDTPIAFADAIRIALTRQIRGMDEIRRRLGSWTWADRARQVAEFMGLLPECEPGRA